MAFLRLQFKGGVDVELTPTAAKGTWSQTNLCRWRSGLLEFIRGWAAICFTKLAGVCREIHFWADLKSLEWFAAGTNTHLYIEQNGNLYDITPPATAAILTGGPVSNVLANWTSITNGGFNITIDGIAYTVGPLNFSAASSLANIVSIIQTAINGLSIIASPATITGMVSGSNWVFTLTTAAKSATAALSYATPPLGGTDISTLLGWTGAQAASLVQGGAGFIPGPASSGTLPFSLLIWSCDNFGQDLIAVPSKQGIFIWTPPNTHTPAALIAPNLAPAVLTGGDTSNILSNWTAVTDGGFIITINGVNESVGPLNFAAVTDLSDIVAVLQAGINALSSSSLATVTGKLSGSSWIFTLTTVLTGTSATLSNALPPASGTDISGLLAWTSATATSLVQGSGGGGAPPYNQGAFVTMPEQIIMAFGSSPAPGVPTYPGPLDPMLVTWCDQSNYTQWAASTTNQAGSFRLSRGNRIVGGLQAPVGILLWTDFDVWSVTYIGFPLVFGFFEVGTDCGLIAQKAATVLGSIPYWMSDHGFFRLTQAGAEQIPCPVWDVVYLNLDTENADKCVAGADYHYSEVWFFYPSASGGSGEIDSYVKLNIAENLWDYGTATPEQANAMARTAWTDQNRPGPPVSADLSGLLQQQDTGLTANGAPIEGIMAQSGYLDIADGEQYPFVDSYVPDFLWEGENPGIYLTLYFRRWPGDTPSTEGPFLITPTTEYITLRARGREVAEQISIANPGTWVRRGVPRIRWQPDGRFG